MEFTSEQICEIIEKLTGKITPTAESHVDEQRLKNIEIFLGVFEKMHVKIDNIALEFKNSHFDSEKKIGEKCDEFLKHKKLSS